MSTSFQPHVGQRVAGYELKSFLRGGGPARVFLAGEGPGRQVPLVVIDPASCSSETWAALTRAVAAATEAAVPGLVPVRGLGAKPTATPHCLADPQVGWSFDRLRQEAGPPSWQRKDEPIWVRALRLGERLAEILDATHAATGVPHRAIIAARCVVTEHDEVKLLDYGVGELEPAEGRPDDLGYRAPEQQHGRGDPRSDVYSLAAVLYELISGERPSPRIPPKLRSLVPRVPQAVDDLFTRALARDPARRFPDVAAMRASIREFLGLAPAPPRDVAPRAVPTIAPPPAAAQRIQEPATSGEAEDPPLLPSSLAAKKQPDAAARTTADESRQPAPVPSATKPLAPPTIQPRAEPPAPLIPTPRPIATKLAPVERRAPLHPRPSTNHPAVTAAAPLEDPPTEREVRRVQPRVGLDNERTEVLSRSSRVSDESPTEVLGLPAPPAPVETTDVLPRATAGVSRRAGAAPAEERTLVYAGRAVRSAARPAIAMPRPGDTEHTQVELRRLSRVVHADSTLVLPQTGGDEEKETQSESPATTPVTAGAPPQPERSVHGRAAHLGQAALAGARRETMRTTLRPLLVGVLALLLLALLRRLFTR